MSRVSFSGARTGRRAPSRGGMLKTLEYKVGERKRIVFPIYDGGLVLYAKPYHPVLNKSVHLAKSNGSGTYPVNKIRCMHPYAQTNPEDSLNVAKSGEICLFCDLSKYENRRQWKTINDEFGDDGFSQLTKKEMKAYFDELAEEDTVEPSYYQEENEDGEKESRTLLDIYILALEIQLDKKGKPVLDDNGIAKYEPIVMPASKSRLAKFKQGVDDAVASGSLDEDRLYPFIENEGTDAEEEVLIGFVDFLVNFPQEKDKMTSGRNMTATPVSESLSVISDDLIEDFESKGEALEKQASTLVNNFYVNLKPHTREEALEMLDGGAEYFEELESEYRFDGKTEDGKVIPSDDERDEEIITKVLENLSGNDSDEDEDAEEDKPKKKDKSKTKDKKKARKEVVEDEDEDDEDEEEVENPVKKRKKSERTKEDGEKVKKKKKKKVEPEEDLDDDEFDGEEIFDV